MLFCGEIRAAVGQIRRLYPLPGFFETEKQEKNNPEQVPFPFHHRTAGKSS
jgi:hypothetical protein